VSVKFISSGPQLDNANPSSKQPQLDYNLDNNDFVKALDSNLSNAKNTYPTKERPLQNTKDKHPTHKQPILPHHQSNDGSKSNTLEQNVVSHTDTQNDANQSSDIVDGSTITQESCETPETLMLSGSLIIDLETDTTSNLEFTNATPHEALNLDVNDTPKVLTDQILTAQSKMTVNRDISAELPNIELLVSTMDTVSDDAYITNPEESEIAHDSFIPDAIISSEVQQMHPITTLPKQEMSISIATVQEISENPPEVTLINASTIASDEIQQIPKQEHLSENSATVINQQYIEEQQIANTSSDPKMMQQAATSSGRSGNVIDKKPELNVANKLKADINLSSIVESVDIQPIGDLGDMNHGMSFGSNDETLDSELRFASKDLVEPLHFETASKPLTSQVIENNSQTEGLEDITSISNQLKAAVQNIGAVNGKRITITLAPESLGRIEVELTVKAGNITAIEIKAVKPETLHILEKNAQMLHDTLKEVTSGNDASLSFNLKEGNHEGGQQQKNAHQTSNAPLFDINNTNPEDEGDTTTPRSLTQGDAYNIDSPNSTVNMKL